MSRLVLKDEQGRTTEFELSGDAVIGRSRACTVRIKNANISREHTRVFLRDSAYYVMDLGSKNGTIVNGQRAQGPVQLHSGDKITVGGMNLVFVGEGSAEVARPAADAPQPQPESARETAPTVPRHDASVRHDPVPAEREPERDHVDRPAAEPVERRATAAGARSRPAAESFQNRFDASLRNFVVRVMVTVLILGFFVAVVFVSRMIFTKIFKT